LKNVSSGFHMKLSGCKYRKPFGCAKFF
jgi:hypothetical protein